MILKPNQVRFNFDFTSRRDGLFKADKNPILDVGAYMELPTDIFVFFVICFRHDFHSTLYFHHRKKKLKIVKNRFLILKNLVQVSLIMYLWVDLIKKKKTLFYQTFFCLESIPRKLGLKE